MACTHRVSPFHLHSVRPPPFGIIALSRRSPVSVPEPELSPRIISMPVCPEVGGLSTPADTGQRQPPFLSRARVRSSLEICIMRQQLQAICSLAFPSRNGFRESQSHSGHEIRNTCTAFQARYSFSIVSLRCRTLHALSNRSVRDGFSTCMALILEYRLEEEVLLNVSLQLLI